MQPTMKLRWKQFQLGSYESHPVTTPLNGTNCAFVLQQWYEGRIHTAENGELKEYVYGEWIDIPIEVES